jgi:hypothetical protein
MNSTIQYQGYTIKAPPGPSDQGDFAASPTDMQVISQVDNTFAVDSGDDVVLVPGTLTFQCRWVCVLSVMAQQAAETQSVQMTSGVTTTDSDTKTFSESLGVSGEVEGGEIPGKVGMALSASFSQSQTQAWRCPWRGLLHKATRHSPGQPYKYGSCTLNTSPNIRTMGRTIATCCAMKATQTTAPYWS